MRKIIQLLIILIMVGNIIAPCHYSCVTCSVNSDKTKCLTCDGAKQRALNIITNPNGSCDCNNGYYDDNSNSMCKTCDKSCVECLQNFAGATNNKCTVCDTSAIYNRNDNSIATGGSCPCKQYFCEDPSILVGPGPSACIACHYSCLTCIDSTDSDCQTCDPLENRIIDGTAPNKCICKPGWYDVNPVVLPPAPVRKCEPCHYTCKECIGGNTNDKCTVCDTANLAANFRDDNSVGGTCPCLSGYYDDSTFLCKKCHQSCITCEGGTQNDCTSCKLIDATVTTNRQQSFTPGPGVKGACPCLDSFYDPIGSISPICDPCDFSCFQCIAAGPNGCTNCGNLLTTHRLMDQNGLCSCIDGFFENDPVPTLICGVCSNSCKRCVTTSTNCIECSLPQTVYFRTDNSAGPPNTCPCLAGYYDDGTSYDCQKCHYSCNSCSGTTNQDCLSCPALLTSNRDTVANIGAQPAGKFNCPCITNYQDYGSLVNCSNCHYSCATCNQPAPVPPTDSCFLCPVGAFRVFVSGKCPCDTGYYDIPNVQICGQCHYTCKTCLTNAQPTSCTDCDATKKRIFDNSSGKCQCMTYYYDDGSAMCATCSIKCETCDAAGPNRCLTCQTGSNRTYNGGSKSCVCLAKFYDDGTSDCKPCHYSCATCLTGATQYKCTSCNNAGDNRVTNFSGATTEGSCSCKPYFFDDGTNQCKPCHYSCLTCNGLSENDCTSCDINNKRIDSFIAGQGQCNCVEYSYDNLVALCVNCHPSCLHCQGTTENDCKDCPDSTSYNRKALVLSGPGSSTGTCQCSDGFYHDGTTLCKPCHYTCQLCDGGNDNNCSSCPDETLTHRNQVGNSCPCITGKFDISGQQVCSACHWSCLTCNNSLGTSCLTCPTGANRDDLSNIFKCPCSTGFTEATPSAVKCVSCNYSCLTCDGTAANSCTSCPDQATTNRDSKFLATTQICPCEDGYYDDQNNAPCIPCSYTCKTCTLNPTSCTDCPLNSNREKDPTNQNCKCKSQFYGIIDEPICQPCFYTCLSCSGSAQTMCTQCDPLSHRSLTLALPADVAGQCICEDGFYEDGVFSCKACHYSCLTCSGPSQNHCQSCKADTNRNDFSKTTFSCPCQEGFFDQGVDVCPACHYSCKSCLQNAMETDCYSCTSGIKRVDLSSTDRTCPCEKGYYDDMTQQACIMCNYTCLECKGETKTDCSTCPLNTNRILKSDGSCSCLAGFNDVGTPLCTKCHHSCLYCSANFSPTSCIKCPEKANRVDSSFTSQTCPCQTGFFDDGIHQSCIQCHYTCQNCKGPLETDCTQCNTVDAFRLGLGFDNSCQCRESYYDDKANKQQICLSCDPKCKICSGPLSSECSMCNLGNFLNGSTCNACSDACVSCSGSSDYCDICKKGFYLNDLKKCISTGCFETCRTCSNPGSTTCLTCASGYYQKIDNTCAECDKECQECYGPTNIQCTDCPIGLAVRLSKCCHPSCGSCTGKLQDNCLSCPNGSYLSMSKGVLTGMCLHSCPLGFFQDSFQRLCVPCDKLCQTCKNTYFSCTSCISGYQYEGGLCSQFGCDQTCLDCDETNSKLCRTCVSGRWYDDQNLECPNCSKCCAACSGAGPEKCLTCLVGFTIADGQATESSCNPMCHSNCRTCSGPGYNECESCFGLKFNYNGNCISSCPRGLYASISNYQCIKCEDGCDSCLTSPGDCATCKPGFKLQLPNRCINIECYQTCKTCFASSQNSCTSCTERYYLTTDRTCEPCHSSCLTCSGPMDIDCLSCFSAVGIYFNDGKCLSYQCDASCEVCSGPTECQCNKCVLPAYLLANRCIEKCPPGFYPSETDHACKKCMDGCKTCTSYEKCLTCTSIKQTLRNGECSMTGLCHASCKTCIGPKATQCSSCFLGLYVEKGECQPCATSCQSCIELDTKCTTCNEQYILNENICIKACPFQCIECNTASQDDCISCRESYYFYKQTCKQDCPQGFYKKEATRTCEACGKDCQSCQQSESNCTSCFEGRQLKKVTGKDGACVDSYLARVDTKCHFTCLNCRVDTYNQCFECPFNRVYREVNPDSKSGICYCPEGTTEIFQVQCQESRDSENLRTINQGIATSSAFASALTSALAGNPMVLLGTIQTSQTLSHLMYINKPNSYNMDQTLNFLRYAHIGTLFPSPKQWRPQTNQVTPIDSDNNNSTINISKPINGTGTNSTNSTNTTTTNPTSVTNSTLTSNTTVKTNGVRILQITSDNATAAAAANAAANSDSKTQFITPVKSRYADGKFVEQAESKNPKIKNDQNHLSYFIIDAFAFLLLYLFVWLISAILNKVFQNYSIDTIPGQLRVFVWVSLPLTIFTFTSAEFFMMIIFQLSDTNWSTDLERSSSMFAIFSLIYFLVMFIYQLYVINVSKAVHFIDGHNTFEELVKVRKEYNEKLFIMSSFIRMAQPHGNAFSRNLFPFIILRQVITSCILVLGFAKPMNQLVGVTIVYLGFFIYVASVRPLKSQQSNIAYIFIECIMVIVHFLFIFMTNEQDPKDEVPYAKAILSFIFVILIIYVLFSIIGLFFLLRKVLWPRKYYTDIDEDEELRPYAKIPPEYWQQDESLLKQLENTPMPQEAAKVSVNHASPLPPPPPPIQQQDPILMQIEQQQNKLQPLSNATYKRPVEEQQRDSLKVIKKPPPPAQNDMPVFLFDDENKHSKGLIKQ